jgi:chorismate dehydratase
VELFRQYLLRVKALAIRLSLVSYLNAAPLAWSFLHGPLKGQFETFPATPARCAEQLANDEVDIGIIPSIEYQRIPGLRIIPGITISSLSKVRSVILVQRHNAKKLRSVALDTSSKTSVALISILLRRKMSINPEFVPHPPDLPTMLKKCDAALLIGDAALKVPSDEYRIMDLAEEWIQWQDRPFVFAVWACRADSRLSSGLIETFQQARSWGLSRRREIAESYSAMLNLPQRFLEDYLTFNVDYEMNKQHISGLEQFYRLASQEDLISEVKPIRFLGE